MNIVGDERGYWGMSLFMVQARVYFMGIFDRYCWVFLVCFNFFFFFLDNCVCFIDFLVYNVLFCVALITVLFFFSFSLSLSFLGGVGRGGRGV